MKKQLITNITLNKIKEQIIDAAKKNFNKDGFLAPTAIILTKTGEIRPFLLNMSSIEEKENTEIFLKEYVIENDAIMIMTIMECFMKQMSKEEYQLSGKSLKDAKDKTEGVVITFETAFTGELLQLEIDREKQELLDGIKTSEYEGRFSNILKKPISEN